MNKMLFLLAGVLLTAVACKRPGEPFPRICTDKGSYKVNDTIQLSNCSDRSQAQRWVLPDGTTTTQATFYYVPTSSKGYTFDLYVTNDEFVNEYKATRTVYVNP